MKKKERIGIKRIGFGDSWTGKSSDSLFKKLENKDKKMKKSLTKLDRVGKPRK